MNAKVYPFVPARPAVSEACKWSEAAQSVALTNIRLCFVWPRIWLRAMTGV